MVKSSRMFFPAYTQELMSPAKQGEGACNCLLPCKDMYWYHLSPRVRHDRKVRLLTKHGRNCILEMLRSADISIFTSLITKRMEEKEAMQLSFFAGADCGVRGTKAEGYQF